MTKLSPEAQAIVDAGREGLTPGAATKEQVLHAVNSSIATSSAGAVPLLASSKVLLVATLVAGMGGGLWLFGRGQDPAPHEVAPVAEVVAEEEQAIAVPEEVVAEEEVGAEEVGAEELGAEEVGAEEAPRVRPKKTPKPIKEPVASSLAQERALLQQAQVGLRSRDFAGARAALRSHKDKFPDGLLARERDAAMAMALCLDDSAEGGERAALAFLKAHKKSPLARQVKASCGVE